MRVFSIEAADLMNELVALGVELEVDGDKLRFRGPVTDELRERIRTHKPGLLELVKAAEHRWRTDTRWHVQVEEYAGTRWLVSYQLDGSGSWSASRLDPRRIDR